MIKVKHLFTIMSIGIFLMSSCKKDDPVDPIVEEETEDDVVLTYEFSYDGTDYELVQDAVSWIDAVEYATDKNGYLAEINDVGEQNAIFTEIKDNSSIDLSGTRSSDGGNASYVWLGANDNETEGVWVWNGNNDDTKVQFWEGDVSGSAVNDLYNNWGTEPDNFGSQNYLAIAITDWPMGVAGQWNDVDASNKLFFLIEY